MISAKAILSLLFLWPVSNLVAAPIVFDLNDGTFTTLSAVNQPYDYTGVYQSPLFDIDDVSISGGQTAIFDFLFSDSTLSQFIRLTDDDNTLPNEGVIFDVQGTGESLVNPVVNLTGATGSYRQDIVTNVPVVAATVLSYAGASESFLNGIRIGEFNDTFPNDPSRFFSVSIDITQSSLLFTDLHLEIFNQGQGTITLSALSFQAIANEVDIGVIPEPATLILFGFGLAGLGWSRRKKI